MSTFRMSAASLLRSSEAGTLVDRVAEHVRISGSGVGPSERLAWSRSLSVLSRDLVDAGLDRVEVIVEYKLPLTSKRADVVLAGRHPRTAADSYVVVELKQWSQAESFEGSPTLVTVQHMPGGPRLHPGVQVGGYCEYLTDFLGIAAREPQLIHGAAYLHNTTDDDVRDLFAEPATEQSRLFTGQRRGEFLDYLRGVLAPEPGTGAADRFLTSAVRWPASTGTSRSGGWSCCATGRGRPASAAPKSVRRSLPPAASSARCPSVTSRSSRRCARFAPTRRSASRSGW